MMVKDHTASTAALKAAVAQAKPDMAIAPTLTPALQTKLDQLKAATGSRFDDLYSLQQVGAHQDALNLLRDYSINGAEPAVRDFATKTAPTVEHHLDEARKLP
jgi:putative membrane protein